VSGAEICGYSSSTYKLFVVDDGTCWDDTGCWLVHGWRLKEPWDFKSPVKYVDTDYDEGNGVKILERWVMFRNYKGDIDLIEAKYKQYKAIFGNDIVFVRNDGDYYTFDDDAVRTAGHAPGFPPAYMMGRAILVISNSYLSDIRGALAKAGVKCHAIM
jgi:hypothetical protein